MSGKYDGLSRTTTTYRVDNLGSMSAPSSALFIDTPKVFAESYLQDNLLKDLADLPNVRVFNSAREFGELKDTPQLIRTLVSLKDAIRSVVTKSGRAALVRDLPAFIGNQYLGYQFGIQPTLKTLLALPTLPAKAAKKLNFLIRRAGKGTTSRLDRKVTIQRPMGFLPTFQYQLPPFLVLDSESVSHAIEVERRMVVNRTIRFPTVTVPEFGDINYRRILGIQPTLKDVYNLLPWSWLVDWFGNMGEYIQIMENIYRDDELVNYGFYSFVANEIIDHKFVLKLNPEFTGFPSTFDFDGNSKKFLVNYVYSRKLHLRKSLAGFTGVKTFEGQQAPSEGLNTFQTSILGALLAKFAK